MPISIPKYDDLTILVVGDVMLDRYYHGSTDRISPEAPVQVVHINDVSESPGGAGNVALNLRGLGCKVILLGLVGQDDAGLSLEACLKKQGVDTYLQQVPDRPTITKLRVLSRHQQLIRLDFERDFYDVEKDTLLARFKECLLGCHVVIFSDYGKGILSIIKKMISIASENGKLTFVDPKNKDFSYYRNSTMLTPNLKEFEEVVGRCNSEGDIVTKAQLLMAQHNVKGLLVTRGEDGLSLISKSEAPFHLRAHASEVYDVSGAGDTVISVLAASIAAGLDFVTSSVLANLAASVVVRKLGVSPISIPELRRTLQRYHHCDVGMLHEDDLVIAVQDAKVHGEKIVMTNGCFDLLHPGHITYLEEAKSLGDRLIVAVNDDDSVRRLKGDDRPLNPLKDRMKLLASLRCVDWVVSFSEDTPERILNRIMPNILVKGGDYQISQIAGAQKVFENGGDVKLLSFVEGHSTSSLIQKIRGDEKCMS